MVRFRPTTSDDLDELARSLRLTDRAELAAAHGAGADPRDVLTASAVTSCEVHTAYADDGLWCIFGIAPLGGLLTPLAAPWQLGTPTAGRHPAALIRETRRYLAEVKERYPVLVNFVDARNTPSLRYLKAVGFVIDAEPQPYGVAGLPFHRFHMGLEA